MFKTKVNNKTEHDVSLGENGKGQTIDGTPFEWDIVKTGENNYHIIKNNKTYRAELLQADEKGTIFEIKINRNTYQVEVRDRFDALLQQLGMDTVGSSKVNEIKAPMPGMVLQLMVQEGQLIKKGEAVMVLEAMKMENILKSPSDGCIKKVLVAKGNKVEKNQVLLSLE
mgnify:CR=1 FL=1